MPHQDPDCPFTVTVSEVWCNSFQAGTAYGSPNFAAVGQLRTMVVQSERTLRRVRSGKVLSSIQSFNYLRFEDGTGVGASRLPPEEMGQEGFKG